MKPFVPTLAALLIGAALAATPPDVAAQAGPSLQDLANSWVQGRFGSPLLCQIAGKPVEGMRRLHIVPRSSNARLAETRIIFVGMNVEHATRCFTDLEKSVPDITGSLQIRYPGPPRRDIAKRELSATLRREGGLEFEVTRGVLRLREVGGEADASRDVDFRGGSARFQTVGPGSDAERLLGAIRSSRKLDLLVTARDGTSIRLPLFLTDTR